LVARYKSVLSVEPLLAAKQLLGERLIGVLVNDIPDVQQEAVATGMRPFWSGRAFPPGDAAEK
jgi:BioD-like phosphotransacetylase family protein